MSGEGERAGCQVGDWHPVKYDAETHTDMDRQGDVAQDWEHGLWTGVDNEWMKFV